MEIGFKRAKDRFRRLGRRWFGGLVAGVGFGMIIGAGMIIAAQEHAWFYLLQAIDQPMPFIMIAGVLFVLSELITGEWDIKRRRVQLGLAFFVLIYLVLGIYAYHVYPKISKPGMPLAMAVFDGDMARVAKLVQIDPKLVNTSPFGSTALHLAAARADLPMSMYLVEHGADISVKDSRGTTAEDIARQNHHEEVADYLLNLSEDGPGATRPLTEQN